MDRGLGGSKVRGIEAYEDRRSGGWKLGETHTGRVGGPEGQYSQTDGLDAYMEFS